MAEVEKYLEANPKNGRGWELLAPVYLRLGRFDDAVRARRNALEIFGPTGTRYPSRLDRYRGLACDAGDMTASMRALRRSRLLAGE